MGQYFFNETIDIQMEGAEEHYISEMGQTQKDKYCIFSKGSCLKRNSWSLEIGRALGWRVGGKRVDCMLYTCVHAIFKVSKYHGDFHQHIICISKQQDKRSTFKRPQFAHNSFEKIRKRCPRVYWRLIVAICFMTEEVLRNVDLGDTIIVILHRMYLHDLDGRVYHTLDCQEYASVK